MKKQFFIFLSLIILYSCNRSNRNTIKIERSKFKAASKEGSIKLVFINESAKSIPLIIPTVMNPNLSPNSKSSVIVRYGQEILFKHQYRVHILTVINDNFNSCDTLKIDELVRLRKQQL